MNSHGRGSVRHLAVITGNYPSLAESANGVFVRQFAHAVARQGVRCTVIHPVPLHVAPFGGVPPYECEDAGGGARVEVYHPRMLSLSAREVFVRLGRLSLSRVTLNRFTAAVRRTLREQQLVPDVLYGHFLYLAGAAAVNVGHTLGIPAFPCVGEGELWTVRKFGIVEAQSTFARATGILANASFLKRLVAHELRVPEERIGVFPNGTDLSKFAPRPKSTARARFGLPEDKFLVCAVGNFLEKKGIARVGEAIDGMEGVAGVFAGAGPVPPRAANTVFCRRVSHDEMPDLMSACDVFVLPTMVEGSCNAIIEAMACGLPIISSEGEFNDDVLTERMSIRLNPRDVPAIRRAVMLLRDDMTLRTRMAAHARSRAQHFEIATRVARMLEFMRVRSTHQAVSHCV